MKKDTKFTLPKEKATRKKVLNSTIRTMRSRAHQRATKAKAE